MRLLLVEDNTSLADSIARALRACGHAVDVAHDGTAAQAVLATEDYDLVLLDLSLPECDGIEVLSGLRRRGSDVPVMVLTARGALDERVRGLDAGADDYLVKPFELDELEARVRALLRRRGGTRNPVITVGPLAFDTVQRTATLRDTPLTLTPRERGVLEILLRNAGRVVGKERIAAHLFGLDDEAGLGSVELYVSRLRKKVRDPGVRIRTIRGLGYLLEE